jgi:multiple sugar transport system substrate-binding protein
MKKRTFLLMFVMVCLIIGSIAGSGAQEQKNAVLVSRWAGPHADFQKQLVKEYPTAEVTIDDIDYGSLKQKQITSFQAAKGTGNYDVVWVNIQWMKEYVDAGYLLPLNDLIKKNNLDTSMYAKGMLEGTTYYDTVYGLPTFAQCLMVVYDKEAFAKYNLSAPKNPEELIAIAKLFYEREGTGIAIPAKQGGASITLYSQLLFSSGGYYFDENNKLDLTSEESLYAANVYDQLVQYSVKGSTAWHHDEVAEAVRTKTAPLGTVISGLANQNHDPERSRIVDTVAYAALRGKTGDASANNSFWVWAVAKNANDVDEAFKFISWLTSPAIEKKQTIANQQISAITSLSTDPEVLKVTPFLPVVMEQLAGGKIDPLTSNFRLLQAELIVGLSEIATTDVDPKVVMARIQDKLKDVDFSK